MNRKTLKLTALAVPFWTAVALAAAPAAAAPLLGSAQPFTVVGASTVTNTGASIVQGDLGVWPGLSITGLGSLLLTGTNHQSDSFVQQAQMDALTAYGTLASQAITADLSGQDLGTLGPLQPGIYRFATSAQLTGTLTLDALNDPNALFIFQIGSTLTTASNAAINVINGGANNGLFWQVGTSATLGDNTLFAGNILADQSITLNTGASMLCGRTLALNGAVTLDNNILSNDCLAYSGTGVRTDYGSQGFSGFGVAQPVPEPSTLMLMGAGVLGLVFKSGRNARFQRQDKDLQA